MRLPIANIEIPSDWTDRSSYQFVSPPLADIAAPMMAGKAANVKSSPMSLVLTSVDFPDKSTADELLKQHEQSLIQANLKLNVLNRQPWPHKSLGAVAMLEYTFEIQGRTVRQWHFAVPGKTSDKLLLATFTVDAARGERDKKTIDGIFQSIEPTA